MFCFLLSGLKMFSFLKKKKKRQKQNVGYKVCFSLWSSLKNDTISFNTVFLCSARLRKPFAFQLYFLQESWKSSYYVPTNWSLPLFSPFYTRFIKPWNSLENSLWGHTHLTQADHSPHQYNDDIVVEPLLHWGTWRPQVIVLDTKEALKRKGFEMFILLSFICRLREQPFQAPG